MSVNAPLRVHILEEAEEYLTPLLRMALPVVNEIVARVTEDMGIPVREVVVGVYTDYYDESWQNLRYQIIVEATSEPALALWQAIGDEIERWARALPKDQTEEILKELFFYVDWREPAGAV